jgi:hypothetical protein
MYLNSPYGYDRLDRCSDWMGCSEVSQWEYQRTGMKEVMRRTH